MKLSFTNETYLKSISKEKIARVKKSLIQLEFTDIVNATRKPVVILKVISLTLFLKLCIHIAKTLDKSLDKLF